MEIGSYSKREDPIHLTEVIEQYTIAWIRAPAVQVKTRHLPTPHR